MLGVRVERDPGRRVPKYLFFWGLGGLGIELELRTSHLQNRHYTTGATPPVHFALLILEMGGGLKNYFPGLT
jgi:hypothetical protein